LVELGFYIQDGGNVGNSLQPLPTILRAIEAQHQQRVFGRENWHPASPDVNPTATVKDFVESERKPDIRIRKSEVQVNCHAVAHPD
jgi:hypothetical protein